jgi:hypothetical protein
MPSARRISSRKCETESAEDANMLAAIDHLRETFTVYLAFGVALSFASAWAAFMAMRAERPGKSRGSWGR